MQTLLDGVLGSTEPDAARFATGRIARAGVEGLATRVYRYDDYLAEITVMHLQDSGVALREHYMAVD